MTTNEANTRYVETTDLGAGYIYLSPTVVTNPDSLPSDFRNLGLTSNDQPVLFTATKEIAKLFGGFPRREQKRAFLSSECVISALLREFDHENLSRVWGESITYTLDTPSTTVATSPTPTASVFTVASATGFAAKDLAEIDLGTGGTADKHYRLISSISTNAITLAEALKEAPAAADTVKRVSKARVNIGANATPTEYSLKFTHNHVHLGCTITIVLYKVVTEGGGDLPFNDSDWIGLPLRFTALSNSSVGSGRLGHVDFDWA